MNKLARLYPYGVGQRARATARAYYFPGAKLAPVACVLAATRKGRGRGAAGLGR